MLSLPLQRRLAQFLLPGLLSPLLPGTRETRRVWGASISGDNEASLRGVSKELEAAPADGAGQEDWDLLGCVETESRAGPGGTKPSADKRLGWKSGSGWGSPLRTACLAVL